MLTVNLLAWRQRLLYRRMRLSLLALGFSLFGIGCTAAVVGGYWQQQLTELRLRLDQTQSQQSQYEQLYRRTRDAWQAREARLAQQAAQERGRRQNLRYQALLEQLPTLVPDSLWLTEIGDSGAHLQISGVSNHYSAIVTLAKAMSTLPQIEHASVQQTQRDTQDSSRLVFSLRLYWQALAEMGDNG
ncbi:PilN domain-containing protein [Dickeya fangzhongdai]|uniref:PilN domain-containing protein n=1 Tax=Dickeya fangzhongdai TaxID=1778540 RepID=UPI000FCCD80D|nr:PilN domain-containing protein [Dickeya fangzhongdai]MBO8133238.1 PilN domain-containing protein [Dickeya fangzhongdai]UGA50732.1 PilN domain-containing protein [Dickeya fangzhongdai]UWH07086.1 PilN domain-containing protein [Dickeya fangzhongdai]